MRYFNSVKDTNSSGNCRFSPKKTEDKLTYKLFVQPSLAHISHKDVGHHRQVGLPPMGSWQTQARITLVASKQNVVLYHILVEVEVHCHPKKQKLHYMNYGKQN